MQKGSQFHYNTASDFLNDEDFLRWRLFPTDEDVLFWEAFILENPDKKEYIDSAIDTMQSIRMNDYKLSPEKRENIYEELKESIGKEERRKKIRLILSVAAACIALLISVGSYFYIHRIGNHEDSLALEQTSNAFNSKDIQLVLSNDKTLFFKESATIQYDRENITITSENNEITSLKIEETEKGLNRLIVPKGKRSSLALADGTKIWVNSGTTLEYPSKFDKKKREIKIEGEIYIEVTKNKDCPFYVNTSSFHVEVLGTRFNVSAYKEDLSQSVVLVEGSVKVKTNTNKKIFLEPDQMLSMSSTECTKSEVNVYNYISWKDGLLQFQSEPLSQITNRLCRYYDVRIECNANTKNMRCTGKLVLFNDFDDVLKTITNTIPVKYSKDGNVVNISKK